MPIPTLSIIIPIYKVESYLRDSIDSVLNQSFKDIEIILVDDGSPDNCGNICDEYALTDKRIMVIHKKNGGLSSARNAGIEIAKGRYITFIDSDDILGINTYAPNMEILLSKPHIDLLEYPTFAYYQSHKEYIIRYTSKEISGKQNIFIDWMKREGYNNCYAWNKIYKRELFNQIRFPEGKTFEDINTFPFILEQCNNIYLSEAGLYYYYFRSGSITQNADSTDYYNLLSGHLLIQQKAKVYASLLKKELFIHYLYLNNILIDFLRRTDNLSIAKNLINQIDRYHLSFKDYLKLSIPIKSKIKNVSLIFFGQKFHYFCYVTIYKLLRSYK